MIVGSHDRTGAARALMGSVAESVIRQAPCNVLVLPFAALLDDLDTRPHRAVSVASDTVAPPPGRGSAPNLAVADELDYELPQTD